MLFNNINIFLYYIPFFSSGKCFGKAPVPVLWEGTCHRCR